MDAVRDAAGKLVCMVDTEDKAVEIVRNGMRTTIQFMPDGTVATTSEKVIKTAQPSTELRDGQDEYPVLGVPWPSFLFQNFFAKLF